MVFAGLAGVILGSRTVPDPGALRPTVDSEMRFFAVWYAAAGLLLLRSVSTPEGEFDYIRIVSGAFFLAGCARGLSWAVVGAPHASQKILMAIELVLPLVILPWLAAVRRRSDSLERVPDHP